MFPREAGELVAAGLRADGVELRLHTGTAGVTPERRTATWTLARRTAAPHGGQTAGRPPAGTPPWKGSGWKASGSPPRRQCGSDRHGLDAGTGLRAAATWLYAVGDAAGKALLTHQGKYEARATGDAIAARAKGELDGEPRTVEPLCPDGRRARHSERGVHRSGTGQRGPDHGAGQDGCRAQCLAVELPIQVAGSSLHADTTRAGRSW